MKNNSKIITFAGYDWRVLDAEGEKTLLLSAKILARKPYDREIRSQDLVETTWEECQLRAYLNGEFYDSLGADDRAKIVPTKIKNQANQWYGTAGGNDSDDCIFLLSLEEVIKYFGDSGQLANKPSNDYKAPYYPPYMQLQPGGFAAAYASAREDENDITYIKDQYSEERIAYDLDHQAQVWWLRSPGNLGICAAIVGDEGNIGVAGYGTNSKVGVRPALWVKL
jgi:hypothetical protein